MKYYIIYSEYSLPYCIDEIEIESKLECILKGGMRIIGNLIGKNTNAITLENKTDGKIRIQKKDIQQLRVEADDIKMDNSRFFNPSDIKPLNYKDLDGKTLKMTVVDNEECLLVAGIDKENNKIYILHSEVK